MTDECVAAKLAVLSISVLAPQQAASVSPEILVNTHQKREGRKKDKNRRERQMREKKSKALKEILIAQRKLNQQTI